MSQQLTSPWKNLPHMTKPREGLAAVALRGKLYVVGDYDTVGVEDSTESYDFDEERWTQAPARMSTSCCGCAAAAIGNSIYVAGGLDGEGSVLDSVEAFDVDTGLWRTLPSMSSERWGCASITVGDTFIVFGGLGENTVESFDVKTGRWEDLPPMNCIRSGCAASVFKNKVYIVGGHDGRANLDTVDVFDFMTRTWTLLPHRMTTRRYGCAAAAVGKYIVVAGGWDDDISPLKTVEMYDVEAERWTELPSMSTKRANCAAVSFGGFVYVVGGMDKNGMKLDSVEELRFSDDVVKGMLLEWNEGSWRIEVVPILHLRTSVIHKVDVDVSLMPTLLSRVGEEERVQTIFEIVRGEMGVFEHTCWRPNKKQKYC